MLELQDIQKDLEKLRSTQEVLDAVLKASGASGAVVFEVSGEPIVETGALEGDVTPLTGRVAALWEQSRGVAKVVGENSFEEAMFLAGTMHLLVTRCGLNHLLLLLFGKATNPGLVRLYAAPASDHIATLLAEDNLAVPAIDGEGAP